MKHKLRIVRITEEYFTPYGRVLSDDDLDFVMEFVKVLLITRKFYKRGTKRHV